MAEVRITQGWRWQCRFCPSVIDAASLEERETQGLTHLAAAHLAEYEDRRPMWAYFLGEQGVRVEIRPEHQVEDRRRPVR